MPASFSGVRKRCFCSSVPATRMGAQASELIPIMPARATHAGGQFLGDHRRGHHVQPLPPVRRRAGEVHQAGGMGLADEIAGKGGFPVVLRRHRGDLAVGEVAGLLLQGLLPVVQTEADHGPLLVESVALRRWPSRECVVGPEVRGGLPAFTAGPGAASSRPARRRAKLAGPGSKPAAIDRGGSHAGDQTHPQGRQEPPDHRGRRRSPPSRDRLRRPAALRSRSCCSTTSAPTTRTTTARASPGIRTAASRPSPTCCGATSSTATAWATAA